MTERREIHKGDIGTELELVIQEDGVSQDVSTATIKSMRFLKPSGGTLDVTATFTTDGTDGKIRYITQDGDLDESGTWSRQAFVAIGSWSGHSDKVEFKVYPNIIDAHPSGPPPT